MINTCRQRNKFGFFLCIYNIQIYNVHQTISVLSSTINNMGKGFVFKIAPPTNFIRKLERPMGLDFQALGPAFEDCFGLSRVQA